MTRTALITGASDRVGRATALELAEAGFHVAIHYRSNLEGAQQTLEACRAVGAEGFVVQADLVKVDDVKALVRQVSERFEHLHVLVNNASMFIPGTFDAIALDDFEAMWAVHVRAPFLLSQGLLPLLQRAPAIGEGAQEGEGGVVVHLVDIGAERPVRGYTSYSVSKAGLLMLVKSMAVELAPSVRSVGVSPGQVAWPPDYPQAKREAITARIPMHRVGTPGDIARLVRFLVLEGTYINGQILNVDGGLSTRY